MALSVYEAYQSGEGAMGEQAADTYAVIVTGAVEDGADDPTTVTLFAAQHFAEISDLGNVFNNVRREKLAPCIWRVTADYKSSTESRQTNDASFSFTTGGKTEKVAHARRTVGVYGAEGEADRPPDFGGGINVVRGSGPEGVEIHVATFDFKTTFYVSPADMTADYLSLVKRLSSVVNSDTVTFNIDGIHLTFEPGELLYLNGDGQKRIGIGDWEFTLNWSSIPNKNDFRIGGTADDAGNASGGILVPQKRGWDYVWTYSVPQVDDDAAMLVHKPKWVVVDEVYDYEPLSGLLRHTSFGLGNSQPWTSPDTFSGGGPSL